MTRMSAPPLPRLELIHGPTPLRHAARLSAAVGIDVWFKRDDLTGLGLGGNKIRALEYLIGDALAQGADCLVTGAGPQSNWAMLAAVVARRHNLEPHLVYYGAPRDPVGNQALAELVGADIRFTGDADRTSVDPVLESLTARLRSEGRRPYTLPRGGATALGAVGYARASKELVDQMAGLGISPRSIWLATGSCGTQAGLLAGVRWLGTGHQVTGVTVSRPAGECGRRVAELADKVAELGYPSARKAPADDVVVIDGHIGPGYGRRSAAGDEAMRLVARTEGVFLDPVFGAKAMAALLEAARQGAVAGSVVFLVTGGAPTLFTTLGGDV